MKVSILSLAKLLLEALIGYLNYKRETYEDRSIQSSRSQLFDIQKEIDRLRDNASPDSTQRADWLFNEYIKESEHLEYLLTRRAKTQKGAIDTDA